MSVKCLRGQKSGDLRPLGVGNLSISQPYYTPHFMRLHRFYIVGKKLEKIQALEHVLLENGNKEHANQLIHQWRNVFRYTTGSRVLVFDDSRAECLAIFDRLTEDRADLIILEKTFDPNPKKVKKVKEKPENKGKKDKKKAGESVIASEKTGKKPVKASGLTTTAKKAKNKDKGATIETSEKVGEKIEPKEASVPERAKKSLETWLFASIIKNNNFDLVLQKATELGVDHVVPVISDHTIKKDINIERSKRIVIEASEQSGRTSVPEIHEPEKLLGAIESFKKLAKTTLVVCVQGGAAWSEIKDNLVSEGVEKVGLLIGPEGGWSKRELEQFETWGLIKLSLGKNVLRAETAAIAALSLVNQD